jgi:hypothetical protein
LITVLMVGPVIGIQTVTAILVVLLVKQFVRIAFRAARAADEDLTGVVVAGLTAHAVVVFLAPDVFATALRAHQAASSSSGRESGPESSE